MGVVTRRTEAKPQAKFKAEAIRMRVGAGETETEA